ncbi:MAG: metallophosphoesterase, partial [Oscillospiraceae bacterium]|nr:metallophosphoesterase [Oscillospiraceae bacterium]
GGSNGGSSSGGSGGGGGSSGGSGGGSSNGEGSSGGGSPINLKLLQISDIHIRFLKIPLDVITDSINRICPDVVLMTGDYISKASEEHVFLEWMDAFISKTSKSRRLFFMCFGNHEHRAYKGFEAGLSNLKGKLERLGVVVLENMSSTIVKNNRTYTITGFTDLSRNGFDVTTTYHEAGYEPHTRIGMTHNPDLALYLAKGDIDLLVAGHFHGGQIWLPFKLEFILLRREQLCKRGITRGLHSINGNRIYINRGIGSAVLPLRLLSKPELTVINLP